MAPDHDPGSDNNQVDRDVSLPRLGASFARQDRIRSNLSPTGDMLDIPAGHDGSVVGDEPFDSWPGDPE
jgi:hypothetical protein